MILPIVRCIKNCRNPPVCVSISLGVRTLEMRTELQSDDNSVVDQLLGVTPLGHYWGVATSGPGFSLVTRGAVVGNVGL
jgi:hypothetical protein